MSTFADVLGRARAFYEAGDEAAAERCYRDILATEPAQFDALHGLSLLEAQRGRYEEALSLIERALKLESQSVEANATYGNVLQALNRPVEALEVWNGILRSQPDLALALYNRGNVLQQLNRQAEALDDYDRVLTLMPENAPALYNRGCVLQQSRRYEEALACFDQMLVLMPGNEFAMHNRGAALLGLNRFHEALASFDRVLAGTPEDVEALTNRGVALYELKRWNDALRCHEQAVALRPEYAEAWSNRANVLLELKRVDEALESWDRALAIKPDFAEALNNRATALHELGRDIEAVADYEKVLLLEPGHEYTKGMLLHARMHCCDWEHYGKDVEYLLADVRSNKRVAAPFELINITDSAADQLKCARTWVEHKCPVPQARDLSIRPYRHDRIRLAYVSADFRDHAAAYLLAGLFEQHDRSRFETIAISFTQDPASQMQARLKGAFERFIDVSNKSDVEIANLMRALEIDIAVDLMGYTTHSRAGVFALRPAPVQINYLGFPATMGADFIDYIFADRFVVPEQSQASYAEKIVWLPETFQANDRNRRISERTPTRPDADLPEHGFVFCAFNNTYKITPAIFDIWMRLLSKVEGSVLMLLGPNESVRQKLQKHAQERGVDPARLRFMPRIAYADHLARYQLADLFLDTFPYNAATTASDALWSGLPLLTCTGESYAARHAGSILHAIGLPELVTRSSEEYENLALRLATDSTILGEIKAKLFRNRMTYPLFDTDRFRRHIEAAYVTMWQRSQRAEGPASFAVPAVN
jgi:protein O-GlcNAc transferase